MRILVITNLYPDARQPTFGTFMEARVLALRSAGASVTVAAIRGVAVHRRVVRKYLRLLADALGYVIRGGLQLKPPQIVEAHIAYPTSVLAWPVARLARAKLVVFCHGTDVTRLARASKMHRSAARFVFSRADLLVANSEFICGILLGEYHVRPERVVVWSPGVDLDRFQPDPDIERHPREVLFVGRLDPEKGVGTLIAAMARLPGLHLRLRVIGDGPQRRELEVAAVGHGVAARFDGALPPDGVARAMCEAGIVAVPSVGVEGLGLVALEAMSCGALVIASAAGGLAETVQQGVTGWLVPPADVEALAKAITEAVSAEDEAAGSVADAIRAAASRQAADHDIDAVISECLRSYRHLLIKRSHEATAAR